MTRTHPIIEGSLMGLAIFGLDMLLRPRFASGGGGMEFILFGIEGIACDFIYGVIKKSNKTGGSFGENITLMRSLLAGAVIWGTDILLRTQFVTGGGMEILKFILQGIIVMFVFSYTPPSSTD